MKGMFGKQGGKTALNHSFMKIIDHHSKIY
jgi:hypothetical protein